MIALLHNCPQEVAHLRRELLIAARHILATDLRNRFVTCIDQLFDENLLIGSGWTTRETVRSLAYSILADLVHHIRTHLSLQQLSMAVQVCVCVCVCVHACVCACACLYACVYRGCMCMCVCVMKKLYLQPLHYSSLLHQAIPLVL